MQNSSRRHLRLTGPIRIEAVSVRGFEFVDVPLSAVLNSGVLRGIFLRAGSVRMHGNSADKALIVCETFAENNYALGRDFILANILGVIPAPHLDNHHDLARLAIDGDVP